MKIAVWHNLPSGGAKRALYYHVRGLIQRGHTLEAWCPPTADQTYLPLSQLLTEHVVPLHWQPITATIPVAQSLAVYLSSPSLIRAMDKHCRRCAEEISRGEFDLLFANACMFFGVTSIGRYVNIRKAIYLQEPYRRLYEAMPQLLWVAIPPPQGLRRLPRYIKLYFEDMLRMRRMRIQAREELLNAKAFDAILVNSLFSRESILRAYGLDAQVCYLGVDTKLFCDQHSQRENFVVGVGTFSPAKNIPLVIQALANVSKPRPRLVWVGNSAPPLYLEELRQYAASAGVEFEAKVNVDDTELVDILNRAMAMVYAPRLEPFGLAPLEANACGLPVIAVAEGGVRESIIDGVNGLFVEHNPKAMALAINHLRSNPDYARKLGENGRRLVVERWSVDAAIDRLEHRLAEAVDAVQQKRGLPGNAQRL